MAKLSADGQYVTVEKGDNLWRIAYNYLGDGSKDAQLAAMNNIPNKELIYPGQVIYLYKSQSGSSSGSKSSSATTVTMGTVKQQSDADNTVFVTWTWSRDSETKNFEVEWYYDTGDGVWFTSGKSTTEYKHSTYSVPSNAKSIRVRVRPVSNTKTQNGTSTVYFNGGWSSYATWTNNAPLAKPEVPNVTIDKFKLTASLDNINISGAGQIQFQVFKDNASKEFASQYITIISGHASCVFDIQAGGQYKVRARAINMGTKAVSEWSNFSDNNGTIPAATSGITSIKAASETSVYLEWAAVSNAKSYDIEYATKKSYFDNAALTTTTSGIEFTHYEITGLESGQEYFFRVRAVNNDGHSAWSDIKSVIIGSNPSAPTTWSSTTTVIIGDTLNLYWVHNSEDGSNETRAELEIYVNGVLETYPLENPNFDDEDEEGRARVYSIDTSRYSEGAQIQWRVRTAGVTNVFGDWSIQRTVDVYAPPTLSLNVTNLAGEVFSELTSFPFYIYALAGPNTQAPIGYHVVITANESYETVDNVGNVKMISAGEAAYSKYFNITDALLVEMTPGTVNLDNNISYTVTCTVSMNSGLTAEASSMFTVAWEDVIYAPNAEIGFNKDTLVTQVRPYCEEGTLTRYKVTKTGSTYTKTEEVIEGGVYETLISGVTTTTGESVYNGVTEDGTELYCCHVETKTLVEGVTLSLYRREFDGSFTELATGLNNTNCTFVTDPHPSLDYARYRVVAITDSTGAVSFTDIPGYPTGETAVIIQWDEKWSNFDISNEDEMQEPPWTGSLLRLPYNIDITENTNPDVTLVNYIGRSNPVSYYGTQIGRSVVWNVEVVYDDKETIYALRRLQNWMGDAYVREPSGTGYWANIKVSFSQKHCEVAIPVTLTITRVEGDM